MSVTALVRTGSGPSYATEPGAQPDTASGKIYRLRDGTRVRVRPILPQDKARLLEGLSRLSPLSRYRRFLAGVSTLSEETLRDLTEIDYVNHMAWVAADADVPDEPGIGVARYIRLERHPEVAEVALTIMDSHQGRGLGTLLLRLLSRWAAAHGIRTFRAYVLEDNAAMIRIFRKLGATQHRCEAGLLRLEIPVPDEPAPGAEPVAGSPATERSTAVEDPFQCLVHLPAGVWLPQDE